MGFSRSRDYKTDKYGNIYNSTKSFQVFASQSDKRFYEAYSYNEKIAIIDNKKGIVWFNDKNFSVTTSKHFSMLRNILDKFPYFKYKKVYLEIDSLNNYDSKTINKVLDDKSLKYNESLFHAVEIGLLKGKEKLKEIEKRDKEQKEKDRLNDRKNRLKENIENLNYKTEIGLKRALKEYKELSKNSIVIRINFLSDDLFKLSNFKKFYPILKDNESLILNFRLSYNFNNRLEVLKENPRLELIKDFKNELDLKRENKDPFNFYIYDDSLNNLEQKQKDFFIYLYSNGYLIKSENTSNLYNQLTASEVFSNLGS